MVRRIRHSTRRGTANRYDGRLDYELPSPWNVTTINNYQSGLDLFADLPDSATSVPLEILNQGSPGSGRNDDDDGNPYDVLFWDINAAESIGFNQDVYIFREPSVEVGRVVQNIPISQNSSLKAINIIIEDFASDPVRQGISTGQPIVESESDDFVVYSSANADVISVVEGNDSIFSGAGNDWVNGGSGLDEISGNSGDDQLYGEAGDDALHGLDGNDNILGNSGNDALYGGNGDDNIAGGTGDDNIDGDAGSDTLAGGFGNDIYTLSSDTSDTITELADQGIDIVDTQLSYALPANIERLILRDANALIGTGNSLDNVITEVPLSDFGEIVSVNNTVQAGGGNDIVALGKGDDILNGEAGNDTLTGGQDNDTLTGGSGADRFVFEANSGSYSPFSDGIDVITDFSVAEADKLIIPLDQFSTSGLAVGLLPASQFKIGTEATTESHRFIYNPATGALFFDRDGTAVSHPVFGSFDQQQIATLPAGLALSSSVIEIISSFSLSNVPNSVATSVAGTVLTGTANDDRLVGGEGNDSINTLAGNDFASGQEGNDSINGGDGKDFLEGGSGDDGLSGDAASDRLYGEAGNDTLNGGGENDTINGGTGNDTLTGGAGADRFNFYDPAIEGIDQITDFNVAEDVIGIYVGENAPSAFIDAGLALNAPIAANQFQTGAAAADGDDRFIYNSATGALFFDVDGNGAAAQIQIATLATGLALTNNQLVTFDETNLNAPESATDDDDIIEGGDDNDNINGLGGNDNLSGDEGNDTLNGGAGNDTLKGGAAKDKLLGLGGNDVLSGGDGNDNLEGGAGKDKLFGGRGSDTLNGGKGRDIFVLEKGKGRDRIEDFQNSIDRLGLTPGLRFRKLDIEQKRGNTLISQGKDDLALLVGIRANQITAADFVSVRPLV